MIVQEHILAMGRVEGFLYFFPGLYSLCVAYHDVYDFYYSGHLGLTGCLLYEFWANRKASTDLAERKFWTRMLKFWIFMFFFNWIMMTVLRTHYVIDMFGGFCVGLLCGIIGEKLSFYPDKYIFGLPASKLRALHYSPCLKCGWLNENARNYVDETEHYIKRSNSSDKKSLNKVVEK